MWLYWCDCFIFKSSFLLFTNKRLCGRKIDSQLRALVELFRGPRSAEERACLAAEWLGIVLIPYRVQRNAVCLTWCSWGWNNMWGCWSHESVLISPDNFPSSFVMRTFKAYHATQYLCVWMFMYMLFHWYFLFLLTSASIVEWIPFDLDFSFEGINIFPITCPTWLPLTAASVSSFSSVIQP